MRAEIVLGVVGALALWPVAAAQAQSTDNQTCRVLEVTFQPAADDLQLAVWLETATGSHVDTLFVTRATGTFGIGNRPGRFDLKSGFRWPYGRRTNVLPIWAHRRGKQYPLVVFEDGRDGSVAYHEEDSSIEGYFCRPLQATEQYCKPGAVAGGCIPYPLTASSGQTDGFAVDTITCPTPGGGTLSKGRFDTTGQKAFYPPRNDLTVFAPGKDYQDTREYSTLNDLDAVSRATPTAAAPYVVKYPLNSLADGEYVVWVEANREFDFNSMNRHPEHPDDEDIWQSFGTPHLGQPSVVYKVPITVRAGEMFSGQAVDYAGYGSWDGSDGEVRSPTDGMMTTDKPGSGAGRLGLIAGTAGSYRVRVETNLGSTEMSLESLPKDGFAVKSAEPGSVALQISIPPTVTDVSSFEVRYRAGDPITDANFLESTPVDSVAPGEGGKPVDVTVGGLRPETHYYFAARAVGGCGQLSKLAFVDTITPKPPYSTIQGCFIATAAYGSAMAPAVDSLRNVRDRLLLPSDTGRRLVAAYYALSPGVARVIAGDDELRRGARALLVPFVETTRLLEATGLLAPRSSR